MDTLLIGEIIRRSTDRALGADWGTGGDTRLARDGGTGEASRWAKRLSVLGKMFKAVAGGPGRMAGPARA